MQKIGLSLLALLLMTESSFAASFMCPNNNRFIRTGDTVPAVIAACGEPQQKSEAEQTPTQSVQVQQYYYEAGHGLGGSGRLTMIFSVSNGVVRDINIAGQRVQSTTMCSNIETVQVGTSVGNLEAACGRPLAVNSTTQQVPVGNGTKVDVWSYDFGKFRPKVDLRFVDGVLRDISRR